MVPDTFIFPDWNQDGLVDFAISTIGTPACLVSNTTPSSGHFINSRLIATTTARNATGARVTVTINDSQKWTKLKLAGDGFMATNEHLLQFGLGPHREVKELLVEWPSGAEFRVAKPSVDGTLLIVEGLAQALPDGTAK